MTQQEFEEAFKELSKEAPQDLFKLLVRAPHSSSLPPASPEWLSLLLLISILYSSPSGDEEMCNEGVERGRGRGSTMISLPLDLLPFLSPREGGESIAIL